MDLEEQLDALLAIAFGDENERELGLELMDQHLMERDGEL